MKKWFEKGKKYLEDRAKKNEEKKSNEQSEKQKSKSPDSQNKKPNLQEKKQDLLKKTIDHAKLQTISEKLLNLKNQKQLQNTDHLMNSMYYKQTNSEKKEKLVVQPRLQEFYQKNEKNFNFLSQEFQEYINNLQIPQTEIDMFLKNPIFLLSIVNFHHKKGPMVEYSYPSNFGEQLSGGDKAEDKIFEDLTYYALPDAIHNKNEDCVYFILEQENIFKQKFFLYGVSYFKQIEVSKEMKEKDSELTRNYMQKSLCVLSIYPFYGYLLSRIGPTIQAYFQQSNLNDFSILNNAYDSLNINISESRQNIEESELFVGISPRTLIYQFKDKVLSILKAIMLEKRIVVYSLDSSSCSNFILSILSLLPGALHFRFESKNVNNHELSYRDFGFPLRIFSKDRPLIIYCTIQSLDYLKETKSYLLGTTNLLIKTHKSTNPDLIIDLDKKTVEYCNIHLQKQVKLNKYEKKFIEQHVKNIYSTIQNDEKNFKTGIHGGYQKWENSSDFLRNAFYDYFRGMMTELVFYTQNLEQVANDYQQVLQKNENLFAEDDEEEKPTQIFDGETIMIMGVNPQDTRKGKFIQQMKQILHQNFYELKDYNFRFLLNWLETENFNFWYHNHDRFTLSHKSLKNNNQLKNQFIFTYECGDLYLGQLLNGQKSGYGVFYDATHHRQITSVFQNDMKNGATKIESMNHDYLFEGEYKDDMKQGQGYLKTKEIEYKGGFENGLYQGFGQLETNQFKYEGEFSEGKKNGMGKLNMINQYQYVGFFLNDLFENNGQLVMVNGDIYSGNFKEGKKFGMGYLFYSIIHKFREFQSKSLTYKGEFKDDKFNGQGIMFLESKKQEFQGLFIDDNLTESESCIIKYEDGNVYSGIVKNFLPNGLGILSKHDGTVINAIFKDGEITDESIDPPKNEGEINPEKEEQKLDIEPLQEEAQELDDLDNQQ